MLPVVRSAKTVAVQIVLYTWAVVICTLLLVPIAGLGYIYAVVALVSGVWFLIGAYKLYRQSASGEIDNPMPLFHVSNIYLTLLFVALAVDPLIRF